MKDNEAHKSDLSEDVAYTYAIEKHIHNWYSEITDVPKKYRLVLSLLTFVLSLTQFLQ